MRDVLGGDALPTACRLTRTSVCCAGRLASARSPLFSRKRIAVRQRARVHLDIFFI